MGSSADLGVALGARLEEGYFTGVKQRGRAGRGGPLPPTVLAQAEEAKPGEGKGESGGERRLAHLWFGRKRGRGSAPFLGGSEARPKPSS